MGFFSAIGGFIGGVCSAIGGAIGGALGIGSNSNSWISWKSSFRSCSWFNFFSFNCYRVNKEG